MEFLVTAIQIVFSTKTMFKYYAIQFRQSITISKLVNLNSQNVGEVTPKEESDMDTPRAQEVETPINKPGERNLRPKSIKSLKKSGEKDDQIHKDELKK
jgi:hypothetical protein